MAGIGGLIGEMGLRRVIQRAAKACHSSSLFNYTPHPQHPLKQLIFLNHECRWNTISLWLWATPPVLMLTLLALWSRSDFKRERKKWRKHSLQFYSTSTMNLLLTVYDDQIACRKYNVWERENQKNENPNIYFTIINSPEHMETSTYRKSTW